MQESDIKNASNKNQMKSAKSTRQQYGNSDRKNSKRSDKAAKLDRKSSRGMIYENEELRLRTININAEVERGQSDIKKLRRENEYLKKEIWVLRDECDRLNKRFKAKLADYDYGACNHRVSGGSGACTARDSRSNSDDSDSCESCRCNEDRCTEECCMDRYDRTPTKETSATEMTTKSQKEPQPISAPTTESQRDNQNFHPAFDHLSVVSEEALSNPDMNLHQAEHMMGSSPTITGSQSTIPSLISPLTPLTPIELVANQLNDLQAMVPPLSYFENILSQHMGSSIGTNFDSAPTPRVVKHTNGWDYNLESPFAQRKAGHVVHSRQERRPETNLTTFVPAVTVPSTNSPAKANVKSKPESNRNPDSSAVETVAITTMPINTPPAKLNSPKNFFAPLKPRLRIDTSLANNSNNSTQVPQPAQLPATVIKKCDPPDLYVANGLASPYQQQALPYAVVTEATRNFPHTVRSPSPLPDSVASSQTKSINLETLLNDVEHISEDILAIQLDKKKARANITGDVPEKMSDQTHKPLLQEDKTKKPYRSEMNLLLSYDGSNQTITPAGLDTTTAAAKSSTCDSNNNGDRTRDGTDSPSPNVPVAMLPFPENHTYIGFEATTKGLSPVATAIQPQKIGQGPTLATVSRVAARASAASKGPPPMPPARIFLPPLSNRDPKANSTPIEATSPALRPSDLVPNKSQLYKAISEATKGAEVLDPPLTKTLDGELLCSESKPSHNEIDANNLAQTLDVARKKARRVSIIVGETNSPTVPEVSLNLITPESEAQRTSPKRNAFNSNLITTKGTPILYAGSCFDLPSALQNPVLKNLAQLSHSTPNSPHSSRRSNSNTEATLAPSPSQTPHHSHHSHNNSIGITSQEPDRGTSDEHTPVVAGPSKCSRRQSDGTVASNAQRISGTSGGGHHHRHHHHHQHSSSLITHNPHHSHHSHQDSNQETGTSISDRNSNSLASSGDSSASFSLRSQRRKLSISSHTGGKIPWCGCWGNGCL